MKPAYDDEIIPVGTYTLSDEDIALAEATLDRLTFLTSASLPEFVDHDEAPDWVDAACEYIEVVRHLHGLEEYVYATAKGAQWMVNYIVAEWAAEAKDADLARRWS